MECKIDTIVVIETLLESIKSKINDFRVGGVQFVVVDQNRDVLNSLYEKAMEFGFSALIVDDTHNIELGTPKELLLLVQNDNLVTIGKKFKCNSLAVLSTWRFQPKKSSISSLQVHNLDESLATQLPKVGKVGQSYAAKVSKGSGLYGIENVFHLVSPNMSPERSDCLDDLEKVKRLLKSCFYDMISSFLKVNNDEVSKDQKLRNAFDVLMTAKPIKQSNTPPKPFILFKKGGAKGGWANALNPYCESPSTQKGVVFYDTNYVVIRDQYPKSKEHFLVMPRNLCLDGLEGLTKGDLPMLKAMKDLGEKTVSGMDHTFKFGFHAVPSMNQLHLHVISQDFDSPHLKNKKHWNSFTSLFFIQFEELVAKLEIDGKVEYDLVEYEGYLKMDLVCHVCGVGVGSIPKLKEHLKFHF